MTSVSETSASAAAGGMPFDKGIFSDPGMRPFLQEYYDSIYAPMRERIAGMKEAEAEGQAPRTVQTRDGTTAHELSAAQYEAAIPTFDKWLEVQQNFSVFDMLARSADSVEHMQKGLETVEASLNPDLPSGVRTVFSDGERILGYVTRDGGLVTHDDGSALQKIAEQANALNLTGAARIAYITQYGTAELSRHFPTLDVTTYSDTTMPTRREFAQAWYPDHDVDTAYQDALAEMNASLENREAWLRQQQQNLSTMQAFLIQAMEDAQAA